MEASTDNSEANLMRISDALTFFGNLHDLTDRECYYLGLTVEEMVTNTLHFPDNAGKKLTIDISATIAPDELLIRIRDDGVIFNPWECAAGQADAEGPIVLPAELVRHIASETMYLRMLNMNNTIVSFKRNEGVKAMTRLNDQFIDITAEDYAIRYVQLHSDLKKMTVVEFATEVGMVAEKLAKIYRQGVAK